IMSPEPVEVDFATHSPLTGDSVNMANRRVQLHSDALGRVFRDLLMRYTREKDKDYAKEKLQPFLNYYLDYMKETIRLNSENAVSEAALRGFAMQATPEQWKELYPLLSPRLHGLRFTHMWDEKMSAAMKMSPGCMFADIEGKTADGAPSRLSDFIGHGRYVLVDFWASWCGPCRAEGRDTLVPLYEKYGGDERFEILGVATWDEHNRTLKAVEEEGYKWPQLFDAGMTPMDVYGFDGIPMIMLFAPDGTMMARGIRGAEIWKAVDGALK
ncbi:MAG: TlpA family protein disulfide reductase, partial [Duncaniella sp.]|nr:TlpA family protein disulfide reductase [Duncaniella sp.]